MTQKTKNQKVRRDRDRDVVGDREWRFDLNWVGQFNAGWTLHDTSSFPCRLGDLNMAASCSMNTAHFVCLVFARLQFKRLKL